MAIGCFARDELNRLEMEQRSSYLVALAPSIWLSRTRLFLIVVVTLSHAKFRLSFPFFLLLICTRLGEHYFLNLNEISETVLGNSYMTTFGILRIVLLP